MKSLGYRKQSKTTVYMSLLVNRIFHTMTVL
jgi:hypothetical protein